MTYKVIRKRKLRYCSEGILWSEGENGGCRSDVEYTWAKALDGSTAQLLIGLRFYLSIVSCICLIAFCCQRRVLIVANIAC